MENTNLMREMIERCRTIIQDQSEPKSDLPEPLQPRHLLWMCDRMTQNLAEWPATRLHRWIGFIQCALIANRYIDLGEAKTMFERAKNAFGEPGQDLLDHLNPDHSFEFEIGGQG